MYRVGQKVKYRTAKDGTVLGKVVKGPRPVPMLGDAVDVKITSRTNKRYPKGLVYTFTVATPWLSARD